MSSPCMYGIDKHDVISPINDHQAVCCYCGEILEYKIIKEKQQKENN